MPLLTDTLKLLGLHHTAAHLDDMVALATKRRWSPTQLLEYLVDREQQERARRSLERRLFRSRLGRFTPMDAFDWAWPTRLDRPAVEAALRLDFLTAGRNLVLVAAQGLGKTMIAQNIAHQAVLAGHHVLFTTAAQLLLDLGSQDSARGLARRLNYYGQRGLLVLDSCGVVSHVELPGSRRAGRRDSGSALHITDARYSASNHWRIVALRRHAGRRAGALGG
jgi:DNA replication protein DnaC